MAKKDAPVEQKPTYEFQMYQSETNPREWTSKYFRNGVLAFEIDAPNSYQYCAAVMERKLRLAVHE